MASKSTQGDPQSPAVIEELLDTLDVTLDRVKVLYEQYFLGIQKQPPTYIHSDVERKLRDLTQMQIRNTGLRYRFATLQQKFGSYNAYWRRTVRQIENGTYARSLSKVGRDAARTGQAVPEEILAAMPKRMREQVKRDREAAVALQRVRDRDKSPGANDDELLTLADGDAAAIISEPTEFRRSAVNAAHVIKEDGEFDLNAYFAKVANEAPTTPSPGTPSPSIPNTPRAVASAPARPGSPPVPLTKPVSIAPSQVTRPNPIAPGSSTARPAVAVESMSGPFPRGPTGKPETKPSVKPSVPATGKPVESQAPRSAKPAPAPALRPPPGMTDADVNALHAKYVKAKELVGESAGPGSYGKLLKTINAQAPKIMEQYKAKGVDFSIVVKDNQVIIKAKPKS